MRRLICAFVVRIWHKQVFSWRGSYMHTEHLKHWKKRTTASHSKWPVRPPENQINQCTMHLHDLLAGSYVVYICIYKQLTSICLHVADLIFDGRKSYPNSVVSNLPNFKTFPNNLTGSTVLQFHLLFLNWCWHSSIAMRAPYRTDSIASIFRLQIFCCLFTNPTKLLQDSGTSIAAMLFILARALQIKKQNYV